MLIRLKTTEIADYRAKQGLVQQGKCQLCKSALDNPVLDHCHKTGHVRGVLCRGCNAMLGHIENNRPRNFLTDMVKFATYLSNIAHYIYRDWTGNPYHPTFRTDDEKRVTRNKRAVKARKAKKEIE